MGRLADILHVSFAIRPEWNPEEELHWSNIHIETITSRQVQQLDGWSKVVHKLENIIRKELGVQHILQFKGKLDRISPGPGYVIDHPMWRTMLQNITLASGRGTPHGLTIPTSAQPRTTQQVIVQPPSFSPHHLPLSEDSALPLQLVNLAILPMSGRISILSLLGNLSHHILSCRLHHHRWPKYLQSYSQLQPTQILILQQDSTCWLIQVSVFM
jgi:hypothetical protein